MNNLMLFMYMYSLSVLMFMLSLMYYYMELVIMFEWMVIKINSLNMEFLLLFDWISLLFISVIMLISSMIMMYSMIYMESEKFKNRFNYLLLLFIISMLLMVMSPNLISLMLGWDGLGLISYWLVMYYQNFMSYNSSMITVLSNRIGDVGILMSISIMMMNGSWSMMMINNNLIMVIMLMIAAMTKSAQIPFSIWLPMAMSAPTPVSALVHSSTLVTAGVYLMIRYNSILMESKMNFILLFMSVITLIMSGAMANFEVDFKKVIALSTLSQLGMMMMILSLGFKMMAFYHLLIHALFKSMLFMAAGIIIHSMKNNQDIRFLSGLNKMYPFTMMSFLISNLALCGIPFMSGFYSKDLIMEMVYSGEINMIMLIFIIISLAFTVSYSIRFFIYLFFNKNVQFYSFYYSKENKIMNLSMMMMMVMSIISGTLVNWLFFFDYYIMYLTLGKKLLTLSVCSMGIMVVYMINYMNKMFKMYYYYMYFFSSMWFLSSIYLKVYKPLNEISEKLSNLDKSWMEFLSKYMMMNFILTKFMNIKYKLFMFMYMFMYMMLMMYLLI